MICKVYANLPKLLANKEAPGTGSWHWTPTSGCGPPPATAKTSACHGPKHSYRTAARTAAAAYPSSPRPAARPASTTSSCKTSSPRTNDVHPKHLS